MPDQMIYNEKNDFLILFFEEIQEGLALEIDDRIILRFDVNLTSLISVVVLDFSKVKVDDRFSLSKMKNWSPEYKNWVVQNVIQAPLNKWFRLVENQKYLCVLIDEIKACLNREL